MYFIIQVYVCVCALIILVAYIAITGKVFIQNYKLKTRVNPLRSSQQDKASRSRHITGGSKGNMELKVVSEEGTTGPTTNRIRPLHPHNDNMLKVLRISVGKYKEKTSLSEEGTAGPTTSTIYPLYSPDDNMLRVPRTTIAKYKDDTSQYKSTTVIKTLLVKDLNGEVNRPKSAKI